MQHSTWPQTRRTLHKVPWPTAPLRKWLSLFRRTSYLKTRPQTKNAPWFQPLGFGYFHLLYQQYWVPRIGFNGGNIFNYAEMVAGGWGWQRESLRGGMSRRGLSVSIGRRLDYNHLDGKDYFDIWREKKGRRGLERKSISDIVEGCGFQRATRFSQFDPSATRLRVIHCCIDHFSTTNHDLSKLNTALKWRLDFGAWYFNNVHFASQSDFNQGYYTSSISELLFDPISGVV